MNTFREFGIEIPSGRSGEVRVVCPQCTPLRRKEHQRERDLSVNTAEGTWFCFHCGWSGGLKGGQESPSRPRSAEKGAREYARPSGVRGDLTPDVVAWFESRRIPEHVLRRNSVMRVENVWFPQLDGKRAALAFPYYRGGDLINVKYRAQGSKDFRLETGCERTLYGLNDVVGAETIVIVEGEIDKLSLDAAGIPNCVSVPDGAPPPDARNYATKFAFLGDPLTERVLAEAKRIILAVDSDEPGRKLADELARRLGRERCWRVDFAAENVKDANELLVEAGPDYLASVIHDATPWPIDGVIRPMDVREELLALYRNRLDTGVKTGFDNIDWHVKSGQLTVITGMPGSGKSEWLDAVLVNLAKENGWPIAVHSPENFPVERHLAKMIEKWSGFAFRKWRDDSRVMSEQELGFTLNLLKDRFVFLMPDSPTLENVMDLAKIEIYRRGIKALVIDPWNEVEHKRPHDMSETEYVSHSLSTLRSFARRNDVHVFIVAHPTKLMKIRDEETGSMYYPVPTPYDISGSAHWYNKADNCIAVWRNKTDETEPVQVHIQKVRFRECGTLGVAALYYDPSNNTYRESNGPSAWSAGTSSRL